ncbi:MAG: APC family permease [Actinomycetota bacterium]
MQTAVERGSILKRLLIGRAITSSKQEHQLLPKFLSLPIFSSDALSSNAYATEEMMLVLALAGAGALSYMLPLAGGVALLLAIVVLSYRQTVRAYPQGGGSYVVARENLGTVPGLTAAAAILLDYTLTVAVSVTAGTYAVVSAAPSLDEHRVLIACGFAVFITVMNLRGVKEAGAIFAIPTYGFVAMVFTTLIIGFVRCIGGCPQAASATLALEPHHELGLFLLARAFASGATALTRVEAIADGVPAFRRPQARNAGTTLLMMAGITISMFLGITVLARALGVRVSEEVASKSVLAQVGDTVFGGGWPFLVLQAFTAGILILAANTAFQDFPRLSAILARDRFMPSQFRNRGDRLVFSNGVVVLAGLAIGLVIAFDAQLTHLIQLYVVGVFTAFTLSQAGMVRRWVTLRSEGWRGSAAVNALGALTTGVVLVVVTITKFARGAWIVIVAMPIIILFFLAVHRHYERTSRLLRHEGLTGDREWTTAFVLLVPDLGLATMSAVGYLRSLRPETVRPVWIGPTDGFAAARDLWRERAPRLGELELLEGAANRPVRALRAYLHEHLPPGDGFVTVVVPEEVAEAGSLVGPVRSRRALRIKTALLFEPRVVVTDVPLLPQERAAVAARAERPTETARSVVLVPISAVHDATVRAVLYARSLRATTTEAFYFATDPDEIEGLVEAWHARRMVTPLVVAEAPFRDFGPPLLDEVRKHTSRGDTVVTVVLPEFIPEHWWENLLHNQTAFYMKRLLLHEPEVVVTSVPFHLGERHATLATTH